MKDKKAAIRAMAEADLETFVRLVHKNRVLGSVHQELMQWLNRKNGKSHKLCLLPRDHGKSWVAAYLAAHEIIKNPAIRILYISATANLAIKQLKFIKDILTSDQVRLYWPDLINPELGKRELWTQKEIAVDHPKRKAELIRDPTVFTAGLTSGITGMHCDLTIMDDVVVIDNAYTEEGRRTVQQQYSLLSSVEGANARQVIIGTRYDPRDLYSTLMERKVEIYNEEGEIIESENLYEKFERVVEDSPGRDGSGQYLWPLQTRYDGQIFGFNEKVLARKRASYIDTTQFYAQYYNDPNDPAGAGISNEFFQYYDRKHLTRTNGYWYFKGSRINVFAAVDFAYSLAKRADYTSIVVVGIDAKMNYYILDIDRFKTEDISEYFKHILTLHQKWDFRTLAAEVTAAQAPIVKDLKMNYIRVHGLALQIKDFRPTRQLGSKEERIAATLQPKYANRQIWHFLGGNCQTLEEELTQSRPAHDDIKDCLASCVNICVAPTIQSTQTKDIPGMFNSRFGGQLFAR